MLLVFSWCICLLTQASLKCTVCHCHCLLQMHLTTLEFPLLKTLFSRFPNRNIICLCVYMFAQSIVCIVNVLQSEPPQSQENPALKMTKGQLTWVVLTCSVVWHLNCFCTHLHYYVSGFYELIYWNTWKFVLQNISCIIAWPFQIIARRRTIYTFIWILT